MTIDRVKEYSIVEVLVNEMKIFVGLVNKAIDEGWHPFGGPVYITANKTIMQTFVKYGTSHETH